MLKFLKKGNHLNQLSLVQVFISYSRKDKTLFENILSELRNRDYQIWIDSQDILPSAEWWNVILDAINNSTIVLFIVSKNSLSSETCKNELRYALENGKKAIPLIIDDFLPELAPEYLQKLQWVKWNYEDQFINNISKLCFALNIDLKWHALRTTLSTQTAFWKINNETKGVLLRGDMLLNAENWLDDSYKDKNKLITYDQRRFILRSRKVIANEYLLPLLNGLILLVTLSFLMTEAGAPLKTNESPLGIINLEFAGSQNRANLILSSWSSSPLGLLDIAKKFITLNFIFIYTYLLFFIYSLKYFITYFKRRRKILSKIGIVLLSIIIILAISDIITSICMVVILEGRYINVTTLLQVTAVIKLLLLYPCIIYIIFSFIYALLLKKRIEEIETYN